MLNTYTSDWDSNHTLLIILAVDESVDLLFQDVKVWAALLRSQQLCLLR